MPRKIYSQDDIENIIASTQRSRDVWTAFESARNGGQYDPDKVSAFVARHAMIRAHRDVLRADGTPYYLHSLAVGNRFMPGHAYRGEGTHFQPDYKKAAVGFLHDVLEDTNIPRSGLERMCFGADIIDPVEILTKPAGTKIPYFDLVIAAGLQEITRDVKEVDSENNSIPGSRNYKEEFYLIAMAYYQGIRSGSIEPGTHLSLLMHNPLFQESTSVEPSSVIDHITANSSPLHPPGGNGSIFPNPLRLVTDSISEGIDFVQHRILGRGQDHDPQP